MSTEIAKSFSSKDLAETFPRQIACLDYLRDTTVSQSQEISVPTEDSYNVNILTVNTQVEFDVSQDHATGPVEGNVEPQFLSIMPTDISDYSISYSGMIPVTGLVFGDALPWDLSSDKIGFLDMKDIVAYTDESDFHINIYADSEASLYIEGLELQLSIENIFPADEPFFV